MLFLRSLACAASLTALAVHGLSFDSPDETSSSPIAVGGDGFTITIQSTAKVSRAPDTADVQLDITEAPFVWPEERGTESNTFLLEIETILARLRPGVDSWNTSVIKERKYYDDDLYPRRWRVHDEEDVYLTEPTEVVEGNHYLPRSRIFEKEEGLFANDRKRTATRLSIRFVDTALVAPLLNDIKAMRGVKVRRTSSDISDETRADMKAELRRKIAKQAFQDGDDYADAFGRSINWALEFEEMYSYEHERYDRIFDFDDDADYTPRPVEMVAEAKTKFSTQKKVQTPWS